MAVKIQNTTAIDDNKNFYLPRVNMSDATYVNTSGGGLRFQLDNPNAYNRVLNTSYFGIALAANENYFAVGSQNSPSPSTPSQFGAVHVYDQQTMKLLYSVYGTVAGSDFALAVGMSSTHLIVGSRYANRADVYDVTNGQLLWTLTNPNAYSTSDSDFFGHSVAISGNYAIVGAHGEDDATGQFSGRAYIFNVITGAFLFTLDSSSGYGTTGFDQFGYSVAASGNYAIVGANNEADANGGSSGKAYIFDITTGTILWTLNNPNAYTSTSSDQFGYSVSISGNYAIVGAPYESDGPTGANSGKAYIFNVTTGALLWTLNNPNAFSTGAGDNFGWSVAISGNYAIVSAPYEDDAGGTTSGKAYIFDVTTGALVHTLNNPNAYGTGANDYFGWSVAISGNNAIVSAYNEDPVVNNSQLQGIAYSFKVDTGLPYGRVTAPVVLSTSSDQFGWSVAISGNYAIVGAKEEDDVGNEGIDSGKAYIFNVTTGALVHALSNPFAYSSNYYDQFGWSVAISGNYAIVGVPYEDDINGGISGKAYIYNVTTGALVHTLNNPNAYGTGGGDYFGYSVAISGNYAIVGATYEDDGSTGSNSGKAYIFNVTTGALVHTLNNPNAYGTGAEDNFGRLVAISGNYAIVSAPYEDDAGGAESGKAYIFNVTTGALLWTLSNPNPYGTSTNDYFGWSVAISGNNAIVGAYQEDDGSTGSASGKAYIFNVTTGALVHTLNNPNAYSVGGSDNFGNSVAMSGNYAIVGAYQEDDATGFQSGKAYIFNVTTGALLWTLSNPNAYSVGTGDNFGYSVSISGNYAVVGAYNEDDTGGGASGASGKAYIFNIHTPQIATASSFNGLEKIIDNQTIQTSRNTLLWTLDNPNYYSTGAGDNFGNSVAISGNYAVVGAYQEDDAGGGASGKAYIYNVTTGALVHALSNPNAYGTGANDYFGWSVAISGNYAIVSAYNEDDATAGVGAGSGKAYIYNVMTGALVHTLDNPTAYSTGLDDYFGNSVAMSGNYAIVGAYQEDDATGFQSGKAYIFNVTTGALVHTLSNPTAYSTGLDDYFGYSVAISGNYAIVGAYGEDDGSTGSASGKAYIFNVTTGQLLWTLNNPNAYGTSASDWFGRAVAISDNYAAIGATGEKDPFDSFNSAGKVYIYNVKTGQLLWTLNNPRYDRFTTSDYFGDTLSISGNYLLVAQEDQGDSVNGYGYGIAYIYNIMTGQLVYTLINPNAYGEPGSDWFARKAASISGNYVIIGARLEDDIGGDVNSNPGKAYIFYINNYNSLEDKLLSLFN